MADQALVELARKAAIHHGIDPNIFVRQISAESNFTNPGPNRAGAEGIAQFIPSTAAGLGVNPMDPHSALNGAARLMSGYLRKYGNYSDALTAYNAGPGRVGKPLFLETRNYIAKILNGQNPTVTKVSGGATTPSTPATTTTTPATTSTGLDGAAFAQAQRMAIVGRLLANQGQNAHNNPLFASGLVSTNDPNPADFQTIMPSPLPGATPTSSHASISSASTGPAASGHYVNPFGSSLKAPGRIDEGVDPTIHGPIRAIGDATVVNLSHNFYKGQPYIVYQLHSGPHAGRYVYVSELVIPHVKVGQHLRAGDVLATGTGAIETGWAGGAKGGYLPLANRAQGGDYTEGKVTSPGQSFAHFLKTLGANASP